MNGCEKYRRLEDAYRFIGFRPEPRVRGIFGDPKAGTPLMLSSPSSAIDLPLKVLVRQDQDGSVAITYNSPAYLGARHGIPEELLKNILGIEALVNKAAE